MVLRVIGVFHGSSLATESRENSQQKGGHHEKADSSYCTSSTVNRCVRGRIHASRAAYSFAVAKPIGNPTDRLHQCWSALPVGTHLDLHSKRMCVCALRCLLWRSLEIPLTPLALALLGGSKSVRPVVAARVSALGRTERCRRCAPALSVTSDILSRQPAGPHAYPFSWP